MSSVASTSRVASLSVFFPCFNEQENIPLFVEDALRVLPTVADIFEIIIINDGSSDNTLSTAQRLARKHSAVRVISHENNRGYGASLQSGFAAAKYEWIFFTDGDLQFDLAQIALLLPHTQKYLGVIGYRKRRADGYKRSLNALLYKKFVDVLFRLHVRDIDCAFKLFHRSVFDSLSLESEGAFISAELLYKLKKKRIALKQVGVDHFPRQYGKPTGSNFLVIVKACRDAFALYAHMRFPMVEKLVMRR